MISSPFPDYVELFVNAVKGFVASFGLELRDSHDANDTTAHSRAYQLCNGDYKSRLVVHRTNRFHRLERWRIQSARYDGIPRAGRIENGRPRGYR